MNAWRAVSLSPLSIAAASASCNCPIAAIISWAAPVEISLANLLPCRFILEFVALTSSANPCLPPDNSGRNSLPNSLTLPISCALVDINLLFLVSSKATAWVRLATPNFSIKVWASVDDIVPDVIWCINTLLSSIVS